LQRIFQERMEGGNHVDPEIDADVFVRAETIDMLQLQWRLYSDRITCLCDMSKLQNNPISISQELCVAQADLVLGAL
jgi:hypothetical protein